MIVVGVAGGDEVFTVSGGKKRSKLKLLQLAIFNTTAMIMINKDKRYFFFITLL